MTKNMTVLFFLALGTISCSTSKESLKKTLEENPDILASVIEKHPDVIVGALQKANEKYQEMAAAREQQDAQKKMDEEFKNPLKPNLDATRAAEGPVDAPITVVEYSDFQCPFCSRGYATMKQVMQTYSGKVRFIFKHLPLSFHPLAMPAAKRFEAIALQSTEKAFKFHDEVFENQDKLGEDGEKFLDAVAKKIGADLKKMKKDMDGEVVNARVKADMSEAEKFGIQGTPGYVINGVSLKGAYPFDSFKGIIDRHLAAAK